MTFQEFNKKLQTQFEVLCDTGKLFRSSITGDQLWNKYLSGFTPEENPIFRDPTRSYHDGNNDKNFFRRYGNIVSLDSECNIITMFDIDVTGSKYASTCKELDVCLKSAPIKEVFFETFDSLNKLPYERCTKTSSVYQLGVVTNHKQYTKEEAAMYGVVKEGEVRQFHHFHTFLPSVYVDKTGKSVESLMGTYRDNKNVFERGLSEISLDTLELVKDLIVQGSLLNGDAHLFKVETFITFKKAWNEIPQSKKSDWCWYASYNLPIAKFRNELIGTLCVELTEGKELNDACKTWNQRVDPVNYMKAKAPISQRQIQEAEKFLEENGYVESFDRRFATLSDINAEEIKHMNVTDKTVKPAGLFAGVKPSTSTQHKKSQFDGIEEVPVEKFMKDILPTCTGVELFMENRLSNNLVTLTTANNSVSKPIFKWSNNYSWSYNGNLTGKSQIATEVQNKGGKTDGVLRFSIMWADGNGDNSDLDAHCKTKYEHIYFSNKKGNYGGNLDVDIQRPQGKLAVENIVYDGLSKMKNSTYEFYVHQFSERNSKGFSAEIVVNGETHEYNYPNKIPDTSNVKVATVTLKDGVFTIEHHLPTTTSSKNVWGVETNQFHKVNLVCLSPNHWGENNVGNKHYFFMIDGCNSDVAMRSFHNENLTGDLLQHRKVFEILADVRKLEPNNNQLAGVGFNATVKDNVILKLNGSHKRTIKLIF